MLSELALHCAVNAPASKRRVSLNFAVPLPTQIADTSDSSAAQVLGQPSEEQDAEVTVLTTLPPA